MNFNIFQILGSEIYMKEVLHSQILAFLLNPSESHSLNIDFLDALLQHIFSQVSSTTIKHSDLSLADALVETEISLKTETGRIDILVTIPTVTDEKLYVVIENKLQSTEHSYQLQRYFGEYNNYDAIFVYLTPEGNPSSHSNYISVSYEQIKEMLDTLVIDTIEADTRYLIQQYSELISTILATVQGDFHRLLASYLRQYVSEHPDMKFDAKETYRFSWVGLIPIIWLNNPQQFPIKQKNQDWGVAFHLSKREGVILEFYWYEKAETYSPDAVYNKLLASAVNQGFIHIPQRVGSGTTKWYSIYNIPVVTITEFLELHQSGATIIPEHIRKQIETATAQFLEDAPKIIDAFSD